MKSVEVEPVFTTDPVHLDEIGSWAALRALDRCHQHQPVHGQLRHVLVEQVLAGAR
jgi:hypothetical protein